MKFALISLALQVLCVFSAYGGGTEFQLDICAVDSVITMDDKIVFIVSGKCNFTVAKPSDAMGNAVGVDSVLDHCTVVIRRHSTNENPVIRQENWDKLCEAAALMKGKKMWMGCCLASITIEDARINFVSCLLVRFGLDHADEAGAQMP